MTSDEQKTPAKRSFHRFHKHKCGIVRPSLADYDDYADVREACERKLRQWEREGILTPNAAFGNNDWLFER